MHCSFCVMVSALQVRDDVRAAVPPPARIALFLTNRLLFPVGDRPHTACVHASFFQSTLHFGSTPVAESQIVFRGSLLVAMAFDNHAEFSMLFEKRGIASDREQLIRPD